MKMIKTKIFMTAVLLVSLAQAKEPKVHQSGTLLQMDSVECGVDENSGKSFVGEMVGTDSAHKKTHALLCQEYLLQSDTVIYRIRLGMKNIPCCCRWVKTPSFVSIRTRCCCKWKIWMTRKENTGGFNDPAATEVR